MCSNPLKSAAALPPSTPSATTNTKSTLKCGHGASRMAGSPLLDGPPASPTPWPRSSTLNKDQEHTMMSTSKTGGQLVVELLRSFGVEYVFGVVGGQTLAITDAIIDTPGIELIHTRHEGAAAVMADAYGRLTGRPAACIATTGPGATN